MVTNSLDSESRRPEGLSRRAFMAASIAGAGLCAQGAWIGNVHARKRPNIVYILVDDMGYGDVSCLNPGSKIRTRHIDRLASNGMAYTDAHSPSAVCTPTRYSLLTGRYPWRSELKEGATSIWGPAGMPPGAEAL